MRLTVVGCSGGYPGPESPASCYLLEHEDRRLVLDLGSGALGPLQRYTGLDQVDAVVLSHLHPDHCLDLTGFVVAMRYFPRPRPEGSPPAASVPVLAPADARARLHRAYDPGDTGPDATVGVLDFRDHLPVTEVGPFRITTTRVVHPVPAYAIRVQAGGRSLVYSGDTAPSPALVDLARGADLALFEATWRDADTNPPGLHLSGVQAGEHASAAGVPRLVLTHLPPGRDREATAAEAATAFAGELSVATAGASYDI